MRDPNRIRPFLDVLAATWEKQPDMRFGQLLTAAVLSGAFGDLEDLMWNFEEHTWTYLLGQLDRRWNEQAHVVEQVDVGTG